MKIITYLLKKYWNPTYLKGGNMRISDYNVKVAKLEGKKRQVSIAQIAEINKINNKLTKGEFYKVVRKLK